MIQCPVVLDYEWLRFPILGCTHEIMAAHVMAWVDNHFLVTITPTYLDFNILIFGPH